MIEVNLGEEEPEDIAVRRYMKAVMESKVLEVLRYRKTKETKIEAGRPAQPHRLIEWCLGLFMTTVQCRHTNDACVRDTRSGSLTLLSQPGRI